MNNQGVRRIVLFLGIEDDSALWEITMEEGLYELPENQRISLARNAVRELLQERLIELYKCKETERDLTLINESDWENVLSQQASWAEPRVDAISIRFHTTEKGERVYWAIGKN